MPRLNYPRGERCDGKHNLASRKLNPRNFHAACMDQSGGVMSAMEDCISGEFELQDRKINRSYKLLMASISDNGWNCSERSRRG